jgi:Uma2 family endonuclease
MVSFWVVPLMSLAPPTSFAPHFPLAPRPKRWTVAEFHRLRGESWLESRRMILIEGEILEMPSPNPPHDASLGLADEVLRAAFGKGFWIRGQMALILGQATDPVPDLAVVAGSPRDYADHPRTALLAVEIAESSLAYDTRDKANLYAAGGIQEYWVVDLIHRQLIVFRDPARDASQLFGAVYRTRTAHEPAAQVCPIAAAQSTVRVGDLLP